MTDSQFDGVLVYDGDCPFCSAAASALRRVDGVGAVAHGDDAARAFLEAQFDDAPFALVLADRRTDRVYVDRDAARELCERAGVPVLVQDVVGENYESIADAVRTVVGADRDPDPYHGTYEFSAPAAAAYADLEAAAGSMPLRME
ncbi:DCC1-like thiol-disulfide oxidoreductase family protein [Halobacterium wangiae]|uniref:DCC1-like thiol-disulfide oxidoreductase family protein n=1 Tax=Halobacterium wangiae TaxID=2902623 RepID=UPI001E62D770|nr:DCC1-like thiol-disulfide oxidoreductase family protein [Halobacterium wangiae]